MALFKVKQKFPNMQINTIKVGGVDNLASYAETGVKFRVGYITLYFNPTHFRNYERLMKRIIKSNKTGFLVANTVEDIVVHELGHVLTFNHLLKTYSKDTALYALDKLRQIRFNRTGLSTYATLNGADGLAEAFVKYMKTGSLKGITTQDRISVRKLFKAYTGYDY